MATTTLPLTLVGMPLPSLTMRPSRTLTRLKTGSSSTRLSTSVSILKVAMSPAESIPYRVPSSLTTGTAEMRCSCITDHARSMVTEKLKQGGVSKSRSQTWVRTVRSS